MALTAVIIDDEPLARMIVLEYLQAYPDITVLQECNDGFEGLKAIQQHRPDLVFLDVQMPKITGFEMLELIDETPMVVFTTAFEAYAIRAFDAHATDYLLKPFSKERFDKAIQKVLQQKNNSAQAVVDTALLAQAQTGRIVLKDNGKIKIIPLQQVQYIEAADDYVKIHTAEGHYLKKKTMQHFEHTMPQQEFVRIHRGYIVHTALINRIVPYEKDSYLVQLTTGVQLPVSKSGYARLKQVLGI
ncbi:MAG TPA: response regulator [Ferruginibacter sp.]|nr:response regulator [Ferruginibacter sp.]HMP20408.1 response regulator [Ferruginibacter sp.]